MGLFPGFKAYLATKTLKGKGIQINAWRITYCQLRGDLARTWTYAKTMATVAAGYNQARHVINGGNNG